LALPFDEEAFEGRLVWILGSPRTGSSWLLRLLIHPWALASKDPTGLSKRPRLERGTLPSVVPINEPYLPAHLTPLEAPVYDPAGHYETSDFLMNRFRAEDPSYFFSDEYAEVWRPEVRRMALVRLHAQVERASREHELEDPLVLIKEPNGSHGAELLMSLFPRSRMIFLVRDGRDVVDSLVDGFKHGGWLQRERPDIRVDDFNARLNWVLRQSWLWTYRTEAVQRAYNAHPEELRTTVRYEDLREDTIGTLRPVVEWLDLDRTDQQLERAAVGLAFEAIPDEKKGPGTARRAAEPGLWKTNMSSLEQRTMHEVMGEKLRELGYQD
jgi:hypothetical protein